MDPKGKVALITGGASGIGLAIAKILLKNGVKGVTLVDICRDSGREVIQTLNMEFGKGKCIFVKADVCNKAELEDAFKNTIATFNQLDIVYSNAGICNENNWVKTYNVHLMGTVQCVVLAIDKYLPKYKSTAEGVIFNTASIVGLVPASQIPHYSASKAGILALTVAFGDDFHYKRTGVKVKAICPSLTQTPLVENMDDSSMNYGVHACDISGPLPSQTAEELAQCVVEILQECDGNGTLWVIEAGQKRKVDYPKTL